MKFTERIRKGSEGLRKAVFRFPAASLFLIITAVLISMTINDYTLDFEEYILISVVGVFTMITVQMLSERFATSTMHRLVYHALALVFVIIWYFLVINRLDVNEESSIRSVVLMFALTFAFLWIPSISSEFDFNKTFMAGFKAFFIAWFFSGVMMVGLSLVYQATDVLLFDIDEDIFAHTANFVFVIFGVIYFLSLIPEYHKYPREGKADTDQAVSCPRFLDILISYIIIPLASIFTLILLIYIVLNIRGSFWKDDLLEVMLVSYIVVLIIIYILASWLDNSIVKIFQTVFPKILPVIVVFQTINSILRISDYGLTYGRYFVIIFGVFAFISSIIFIFRSLKENGYVAMILIVFMLISITYPIDAFSISKNSQMNLLERTLDEQGMLVNGKIVANENIDEESMDIIISTSRYIERMGYSDELDFLPEDFDYYKDFYSVYGFSYYHQDYVRTDNYYYSLDYEESLPISGYDILVNINFSFNEEYDTNIKEFEFDYNGREYLVVVAEENNDLLISVFDDDNNSLIDIAGVEFADKYDERLNDDLMLSIEEASFVKQGMKADVKLIFQHINVYDLEVEKRYNGSAYMLIKIK